MRFVCDFICVLVNFVFFFVFMVFVLMNLFYLIDFFKLWGWRIFCDFMSECNVKLFILILV